ncbi:uncharacterized protein LOC113524923 [Pangasianodon hypophthalmus]|uniref:uncharacterized protein LOC113524923 n=1 Tax=Pangasianodon hypophthalmus TaxID=310915 RepID=UPI0023074F9C|nr:uncharacterized protein LOC113524923 [Pangasianodon hypophthalmus]
MMWVLTLTTLLLCITAHTAESGLSIQRRTEGSNTVLSCKNDSNVTWSKGVGGRRADILTAEHDPDQRIILLTNFSLMIKNLSVSDSGMYYLNSVPAVKLTVTPIKVTDGKPTTAKRTHRKPKREQKSTKTKRGPKHDSDEDDDSSERKAPEKRRKHETKQKLGKTDSDEDDDSSERKTPEKRIKHETEQKLGKTEFSALVLVIAATLAGVGLVMLLWKGNFRTQSPEPCVTEHYYETIDNIAPATTPGSEKPCKTIYVLADYPAKLNPEKKNPSDVSCSTSETLWRKNPIY